MVTLTVILWVTIASVVIAVVVAPATPVALEARSERWRTIAQVVIGVGLAALLLIGLGLWWYLSQIHIG